MKILAAHGRTWLTIGVDGGGNDPELRAIHDEVDNRAAERVPEAIGFTGSGDARDTAPATVRAYGGMVKSAIRE